MGILDFCDALNSLFQALFFVCVTNKIASKENKLSKPNVILLTALIFIEIEVFTKSGINGILANMIMVAIALLLMLLLYRKSIADAFIGFGLTFMYITLFSYFLSLFYKLIIINLNLKISVKIQTIIFIYAPIFLSYYIFYKFRKQFINFGLYLKTLKHSIVIIQLIDYSLIFISVIQGEWTISKMAFGIKAILIAIVFMIYVFEAIYFAKINDKSKELEVLNDALNSKIMELRKIKHDYGSEISAIYGLYQLGKYEQLGKVVKGVIERNNATVSAIEIKNNENPMITSLLNSAAANGINVMIFDKADYNGLKINDNDLLRLVSNIVNNAVDSLKNTQNPTIRFYSHDSYDGIDISIENNGPHILASEMNKIFNVGFTTKENENKDRGFGLSIVNDIVNKCNGVISVESEGEWTKFQIRIPKNEL
jgi:two-component system sensor histidine kinase AgrC